MTTLEYMLKQLRKAKVNLEHQTKRGAPPGDLENLKEKIAHYEKVCEVLKCE